MRKRTLVIVILSLAAVLLCRTDLFAQPPQSKCAQIRYSPSDVSLQNYRLDRIEGQAVYASPSQKWELGSANGVCVTLLNRKNGFAANITTDDKGQFEFSNIAPQEYVLMAFAGDLQQLTIHIQLTRAGKAIKPQRLLLHLREKEDQRKTYVTAVTNLALRKELLVRDEEDQRIRNEMIKSGVDHPSKAILARMDEIGLRNTERMKTIIKQYGWPGPELVGWDGTEAAFILIQHADHSFQKELLPLMQKEFKAGILSGPNYALFIDRVLVEDGRPQIYGLRAKPFDQWVSGQPVLYPIEDEANVDKRRAEVGLSSLAEYKAFLKKMYYPQSK
jgi:uncharacterized protein DUF6624